MQQITADAFNTDPFLNGIETKTYAVICCILKKRKRLI